MQFGGLGVFETIPDGWVLTYCQQGRLTYRDNIGHEIKYDLAINTFGAEPTKDLKLRLWSGLSNGLMMCNAFGAYKKFSTASACYKALFKTKYEKITWKKPRDSGIYFSDDSYLEEGECLECGKYGYLLSGYCYQGYCYQNVSSRTSGPISRALGYGAYCETFDPKTIFERHGWRCHWCGNETPRLLRGSQSPLAPTLDHVIPLSKGGSHTPNNTVLSCLGCNVRKGDRIWNR